MLQAQPERNFLRYMPSKQVISRQYIDKQVMFCLFASRALHPLVTGENFKITLQILQILTPKFHSNSGSALCKG